MATIDIDFDVFKALTVRRHSEQVTYNDVLRELLEIEPSGPVPSPQERTGWVWKGVFLPNGTDLRADYKGNVFRAKIEGGQWVQEGRVHGSPSAAAFAVTDSGVNGWYFWQVRRPSDSDWGGLYRLRPDAAAHA